MSGSIGFSNGEIWFINQWGWRTLWTKALEDAASDEQRSKWRTSLTSHGLSFRRLDIETRRQVALALMSSVVTLEAHYRDHPDDYDRSYADDLRRLAGLLREEASTGHSEAQEGPT